MDRAYKLTRVQRRDEWKSRYSRDGNPDMVDYAIALEGESGWIKLSQKITTKPPQEGSELFGHVEDKTSANGNAYRKFVKSSQQGQNAGVSADKIDYIIQMLEELTMRRDVVSEVPDEPTTLEDPFAGMGI